MRYPCHLRQGSGVSVKSSGSHSIGDEYDTKVGEVFVKLGFTQEHKRGLHTLQTEAGYKKRLEINVLTKASKLTQAEASVKGGQVMEPASVSNKQSRPSEDKGAANYANTKGAARTETDGPRAAAKAQRE